MQSFWPRNSNASATPCLSAIEARSLRTRTDSSITSELVTAFAGSFPGTTTRYGHLMAALRAHNSSHSFLISAYESASLKVMCSIELMLSGSTLPSANRFFRSDNERSLRNRRSLGAQISTQSKPAALAAATSVAKSAFIVVAPLSDSFTVLSVIGSACSLRLSY